MGTFNFPDELIFELWGVIGDWKNGRLSDKPPESQKDRQESAAVTP